TGDPPLDVLTDPLTREVVWFTVWQGLWGGLPPVPPPPPAGLVLARDPRPARHAGGLCARALPLPGPRRRRRGRRRAVRAADDRRGARVPRDPSGRHRAGMGADLGRARVFQRRRRRP